MVRQLTFAMVEAAAGWFASYETGDEEELAEGVGWWDGGMVLR